LVGHNLPPFRLPKTDGTVATAVSLQGKPTVVTVLSTWAPSAAEQLPALAKVARTYSGVNVVPLYLGERAGKVEAALARGGYDLPAIVDSKAILGDQLGVPNVPTQYFVDRTGKVVSVHVGVMPEAELLSRLLNSGL
jgi:peroxiredoxin